MLLICGSALRRSAPALADYRAARALACLAGALAPNPCRSGPVRLAASLTAEKPLRLPGVRGQQPLWSNPAICAFTHVAVPNSLWTSSNVTVAPLTGEAALGATVAVGGVVVSVRTMT